MTLTSKAKVLISIVTWNNEETIDACLNSLLNQKELVLNQDYKVIVRDNNSGDSTKDILKKYSKKFNIIFEKENLGFSKAHNLSCKTFLESSYDYFFVLNPDAALFESSLFGLKSEALNFPEIGSFSPLLLRTNEKLEPLLPKIIDSSGIFFTPELRHFDRFAGEKLKDHNLIKSFMFGGTGAALFLSKECINDINIRAATDLKNDIPELFDESFFAYREDAELAWRMLKLGWKTLFLPNIQILHQRKVTPERRDSLPGSINLLGVQNRFLLQFIHLNFHGNYHCLVPAFFRNILVTGACITKERSSLQGIKNAFSYFNISLKKRKFIKEKQRVCSSHLAKYFSYKPYFEPVLNTVTKNNTKPQDTKNLSIHAIIINYFGEEHLGECLKSLTSLKKNQFKLSIDIVDNSLNLRPNFINDFINKNVNLKILTPKKNLGFSGAINKSAKSNESADYFLILNPDTKINENSLLALLQSIEEYDNLAAIQPILEGEDNKPQFGFFARGERTLLSTISELVFLHKVWPNNPFEKALLYKDDDIFRKYVSKNNLNPPYHPSGKPFPVDQPAASCLLVKNQPFFKINGFDENFHPAWFEDVDFCLRLKKHGHLLASLNTAKAFHIGGYSAEKISKADFFLYWHKNMQLYAKKHYAHFWLFKVFFILGIILRLPIVLIKTLKKEGFKKSVIFLRKIVNLILQF